MDKFEAPELIEIDGVRTMWTKASRPFTAALMFRVGSFDESLRTRGITHLTEHLALAPLKDTELQYNGAVEGFKTVVFAQGHPDRVGEFMTAACRNLSDLPTDRLDVESAILQREADMNPGFSYATQICAAYFGSHGPGLMHYPEYALSWLGAKMLRDWAERFFTRSNAVLALTGRPPSDWVLPLPDGDSQPYELPERAVAAPESPVLLDTQTNGVSWGALVDVPRRAIEPAVMTSVSILSKRLHDRLRHDLGRVYTVSDLYFRLDGNHVYTHLGLDSDTEHSREVATEFHRVLEQYVDGGPTTEELERQARTFEDQFADYPDMALRSYLMADAEAALCGWEQTASPSEVIDALRNLDPDGVRSRFAEAYRQSFMVADLPEDTLDTPDSIATEFPLAGTVFVRKYRARSETPPTIRIGRAGISIPIVEGWLALAAAEIEIIQFHDSILQLRARRGWREIWIDIDTARYRRGDEMKHLLHQEIPEAVFIP